MPEIGAALSPGAAQNVNVKSETAVSWPAIGWFGALLLVCYAPVLYLLVRQWNNDADMGHGFFVPVVAAYIAWQKKDELARLTPQPNRWGILIVLYGAVQLLIATMGAELFLARTAFLITVVGLVLALGGVRYLKTLAFPLFLLFFMVPIPGVIYNKITFPLQIIASEAAERALSILNIPVLREGNVLELPDQTLNVVEACSGIRSLLSLSFVSSGVWLLLRKEDLDSRGVVPKHDSHCHSGQRRARDIDRNSGRNQAGTR